MISILHIVHVWLWNDTWQFYPYPSGYTDTKATIWLEMSEIMWLQLGNCHEQCEKKNYSTFLDINVMA